MKQKAKKTHKHAASSAREADDAAGETTAGDDTAADVPERTDTYAKCEMMERTRIHGIERDLDTRPTFGYRCTLGHDYEAEGHTFTNAIAVRDRQCGVGGERRAYITKGSTTHTSEKRSKSL